jgi:hypothetical protein
MTDALLILVALFFLGTASGEPPDSSLFVESETTRSAEGDSSNMVAFFSPVMDAQTRIQSSLEMVHAKDVDIPKLADALIHDFGWTMEQVRETYLTIALDAAKPRQFRGRALSAYLSLVDDDWLDRVSPLFADEDENVRRSALMLSLGTMAGAKEGLSFFSNQIERLKVEKQFRRDVYTLSGHFHGIVHYKFVPEGDIDNIMLFYRGLSDSPPFAECAVIADSFLARFDSQWTNSPERRILLERWKDSPELGDYPRDSLQKAYVQEFAEQKDSSGKSGSDDSVFSATSAESGLSPEPPSTRCTWIVGIVALLAVSLVLVFLRI